MPFVKVNGLRLHYHVKGTGIPIIFIHPPLLTSANFAYQKHQLSDEFQVVTFDIRGHGHSEVSVAPLTYPLIVEDIKQLMDALGIEKCYLCGYSTGGSIALEAMLTYPQRFFGGILVSAMSEASDWWLKSRIAAASMLSGLKAKNLLSFAISTGNSDMEDTFKNLFSDAKLGNVENMEQYYRFSGAYNCTHQLNQIKSPQLLIFGEKDKSFHRYAKILQYGLPDNELYIIRGEKHQIPTKAARYMNDLIRKWVNEQQHIEEKDRDAHYIEDIIAQDIAAGGNRETEHTIQ